MKKRYIVNGGNKINGVIDVQGSKNSSLAIIVASLLCKDIVILDNVPMISDVKQLLKILKKINCKISICNEKLIIDSKNVEYTSLLFDEIKSFRASYYFIGAFLSLFKKVETIMPGGCNIGKRPIDQHIKGLTSLNASVYVNDNIITAECENLIGNEIYLDIASVGATINIILASIYASKKTIISHAAREPEVVDLIKFLNQMGASIIGEGSSCLIISPVEKLHGGQYKIMPDRIVTGTYLIYGAALANKLTLNNINTEDNHLLINTLINMGVNMKIMRNSITIYESSNLKKAHLITGPHPLFPSDLQQVMSALFLSVKDVCVIEEKLFENRFSHLEQLKKMNGKYFTFADKAIILYSDLIGSEVNATDLRGGAALLLSSMLAKGKSIINNVMYIERGYQNIVKILQSIGVDIIEEEYEEA